MDMNDYLNVTDDQIKTPPALPEGWYAAVVSGPHEVREVKTQDGIVLVDSFPIRLTAPMPEVDQAALREVSNWNTRQLRVEFWRPRDQYVMAKHFFGKVLKLNPGSTLQERCAAAEGRPLKVLLKNKQRKGDDDRVDTNVARTLPFEDAA